MRVDGRVALVTGGGKGIGASTCRLLAERGARVAVNYLQDAASAQAVVGDILAAGGTATALQGDVRDPHESHRLVDEVVTQHGGLDIVVCNAHIAFTPTLLPELGWDELISKVEQELAAAFT